MEDIFRRMMARGLLRDADPKQLALEFYAPLFLLISVSDHAENREQYPALLAQHIQRFLQNNAAGAAKDLL